MIKVNGFLFKSHLRSMKISFETLMEEVEPVVMETKKFEWEWANIISLVIEFPDYWEADAKIKVIDFSISSTSTSLKPSIETFVDDTNCSWWQILRWISGTNRFNGTYWKNPIIRILL